MLLLTAADNKLELGDDAEALALAEESLSLATSRSWEKAYADTLKGTGLAERGKFQAAETVLVSGYQSLLNQAEELPITRKHVIDRAGQRLVDLYRAWNKPDELARWEKEVIRIQRQASKR